MPEYPGVYVEEVPGAFRPISGVSPSIGGVVGLVSNEGVPLGHGSLRPFPGRPNPVWQSDWKYVNVRREVLFIESSLDQGLQWAVFQPNGLALLRPV